MFYKWDAGHILLVLVYINDIIITGSNHHRVLKFIFDMQNTFALKDLGELNCSLRVKVNKTKIRIHLSKIKYIADLLAKHGMRSYSPVPTPMTTSHYLTKNQGNLYLMFLSTKTFLVPCNM